jgi:hypothetical protein
VPNLFVLHPRHLQDAIESGRLQPRLEQMDELTGESVAILGIPDTRHLNGKFLIAQKHRPGFDPQRFRDPSRLWRSPTMRLTSSCNTSSTAINPMGINC